MQQLFVTGIGTGVGKTIVSAFLTSFFEAAYWKPIQSGDLEQSDSDLVQKLVGEDRIIFPERYRLAYAASPHQSAAMENKVIRVADFSLPVTSTTPLVVEGAGGLFVPLNEDELMIDLIVHLQLPTVLVIQDYLGCINHSLLTMEALVSRGIEIAYVVFNGDFVRETKSIIEKNVPLDTVQLTLPFLEELTPDALQKVVELQKKLISKDA